MSPAAACADVGVHRRFTGRALLPDGELRHATLTFDGDVLVGVAPPVAGEAPLDGLLVPGLVNAYTRLDHSHLGLVDGSGDLVSWTRAQFARRGERGEDIDLIEARIAARAMALAGTALVSDVASGRSTADVLREAGMVGVVQRERVGQDRARTRAGIQDAAGLHHRGAAVWERPSAHAPYSTHPDLARAMLRPGTSALVPGSVLLAEDAEERSFLRGGDGAFADLLHDVGVLWSFYGALDGPVAWLREVGALGPGTLAVHGVALNSDERQQLAEARVPLVVCARANLHVSGTSADIPDLLRRGVRLALGTGGLTACPDQDVLGEIPTLAELAPDVPLNRWLSLATRGGAQALRVASHGRLEVGSCPGLLQLDTDLAGLRVRPPQRRWLVPPGSTLRVDSPLG